VPSRLEGAEDSVSDLHGVNFVVNGDKEKNKNFPLGYLFICHAVVCENKKQRSRVLYCGTRGSTKCLREVYSMCPACTYSLACFVVLVV